MTGAELVRKLVAIAIFGGLSFATGAHAEFGDYGEGGWGISNSTLQDLLEADMMNRSIRTVLETSGIDKGTSSRPKTRSPLDVKWQLSVSGRYARCGHPEASKPVSVKRVCAAENPD